VLHLGMLQPYPHFECCKNAKCNFIFPLRQKIGEQHGFNVSGAVSSIADRISAASAVLHVFHVYPVNFEFRFDRPKTEKIHVRTTLDVDGVEKVKGSVNVEDDSELGGLRFQVLHSTVGSWPYPQTLDKDGETCQ
jgi:hypothetical protein